MSYEEFLIYSARLGEFEDVKFCIDEKVDPNTQGQAGNTALRKEFLEELVALMNFHICRYGMR